MEKETKNRKIRNFARQEHVWLGDGGQEDIYLPGSETEIYLKHDTLYLKRKENRAVTLNGKTIQADSIRIDDGDRIELPNWRITFFKDKLEIEGEDPIETTLVPVHGEEEYFPGFPVYKRSPRMIYREKEEKIEIKAPPAKREISKGSLAQLIIPSLCMLAFTIAMGIFMKRGAYVYMSAGMTVITLIFSIQKFFGEKKEVKEENKKRETVYEEYLLATHKKIRRLREEERAAMDYQNPTIQELERMISGYSSRIYERTALDDDFLQITLGYYTGKSRIQVDFTERELKVEKDELTEKAKSIPKTYEKINQIPVSIDLKKAHLGLVGSKKNIHEQLKVLLMQLTFFQSYHDLQIVFVHAKEYADEFSYIRWYPHLRIKSINAVAEISNEQTRDQILGSIQQMLKDRKIKQEEEKQEAVFLPHLLFIIDEPKMVLNHAIMEYLQSRQLDLGFSIIYTTDQRANLPENVKSICLIQNSSDGLLLMENGERKNRSFQLQSPEGIHLEEVSRNLGVLQHEQGISSKIPESITFFDMYQVEHPEQLMVRERWEKNQSHKSLAVPLGLRAEDDIVELNLHEKAHGPHGLVAGTTGSGKSEIVQSYILSLAVNFHPHEVGFLLIDYKGGGMANLFRSLPHLLGTITNLDKAESMRAMASIKSELSRRQRIFSECDVNHINGYNKLFKLGKVDEPLPHLFMISDEFAELKKEQPEFMAELISTARIGRSLGIHLILATQKPSGVVDDQIWTNSKFRLCLKVQNAGDSKEMLKTPDAANITQAGRAYLQVGNNEIYELFQSAWSGATYEAGQTEEEREDDRVYLVNSIGQGELLNQDLSGPKESSQIKETQLDAVVKYIHELYENEHAIPVKKPWLLPLPAAMESPYTRQVKDSASFIKGDYTLGIGMIDIPEEQKQEEYVLDLIRNGHLLYMASSGYGKTMFLTNIILGLSMKNAVRHINFYILDLGNSAMIPLKNLPHVADYIGMEDEEKIRKLQKLILDEIAERKRKFAKAMVQNIYVYNETQPEPLKVIVLAIDNFDALKELGDTMDSFAQKVARDGASLGIYLLVTMTRVSAMKSSVQNNFKERIAGFNFDEGENRALIGRSQHSLPEDKRGRALVKKDNIDVMQIYMPVPCETELEYMENLKALIRNVAEASSEQRAQGIPVLPEELHYDMLSQYPGYEDKLTKFPVGIEVENLEIQYLDTEKQPAFIIGNSGTGRTTIIKNMLRHISGQQIFLFDAKNRNLKAYEHIEGVNYIGDDESVLGALQRIKQEAARRKEMFEKETQELTFKEFGQTLEPLFIVVDIIQELYDCLGGSDEKLDILAEAVEAGMYVIVSADAKLRARNSVFLNMLVNSKFGVVLGNIKDQSIFSYSRIREENRKMDIGYYSERGENKKVKLMDSI